MFVFLVVVPLLGLSGKTEANKTTKFQWAPTD